MKRYIHLVMMSLMLLSYGGKSIATEQYDVLIIGGGVSGMRAAEVLMAAGKRILVLEASERLGGRVKTDNTWGLPLDMGGAWIHGINENPMARLAGKARLIPNSYHYSEADNMLADFAFYNANAEALTAEERMNMRHHFSLFMRILRDSSIDDSIENLYEAYIETNELNNEQAKNLNYALQNFFTYESGANLSEISYESERVYENSPYDGANALVKGGYESLFKPMMKTIPVRFHQFVTDVNFEDEAVTVKTSKSRFQAKRVILTVPLGILKANKIQFTPELPKAKQMAIDKLKMGHYEKMYLFFDELFWAKDIKKEWIGMVPEEGEQAINIFNYYKYSSDPILIAFTAGRLAKEMDKKDLKHWVMAQLKQMYGKDIPEPKKVLQTHWMDDEKTLGSYSYIPLGVASKWIEILAEPINQKLFFAGEATSYTDMGTVHGAYETGSRAAQEILELDGAELMQFEGSF